MHKWEYYIYGPIPDHPFESFDRGSDFFDDIRELDIKIDQLGKEGWELLGTGSVDANYHL